MKSGILGGFLTGTVLSGLVLGGASLMTYPTDAVPSAGEVDVPAGSEFRQAREDTEASLPASDETPDAASGTSPVEAPEPDDLASLEDADTEPASQPSTGEAQSGLTAPDAGVDSSGFDLDTDDPVLPSPQTLAPEVPESEDDLAISTEPAQPVQPEIEEQSGAFDTDAEPEPEQQPAEEEQQAALAPEVTPEAEPEPAPEPQTEPETAEEPSSTIGNQAEGVTTGRLPSVGDEEEAAPEPEVETTTAADPNAMTPLERYSVPFENPEGKPLMSFVLIDQGDSPIGFDALAAFPYPISYAVDANWSGAADAMQRYRDAGLEVLAMVNLPEGAGAADTEVAMQTYLSALPEAVAVIEGPGSGLQSNREATEQLIPILLESGHGLVLNSEGLDTAQKLIAREGVPALSVFRDIDGNDQSATVIRRFLDQAAFRAGQEDDGVVIVGRLRGETVSALLLWGLQDRASSVAIAPVSALLKAQIAE